MVGREAPSAGKAGGLRGGSPTAVSPSRRRARKCARNCFCGSREAGAAWWPSARLIVRRVRRDYKKEEKKRGLAEKAVAHRTSAQDGLRGLPRTLPGLAPSPAGAPAQHIPRPVSQPTVVCPVMQPPK